AISKRAPATRSRRAGKPAPVRLLFPIDRVRWLFPVMYGAPAKYASMAGPLKKDVRTGVRKRSRQASPTGRGGRTLDAALAFKSGRMPLSPSGKNARGLRAAGS